MSAPRTALVTGASRGIGLALTLELARRGWHVLACCREPQAADDLLAAQERGAVELMRLDVADGGSIRDLAENLSGRPVDLLVNNAGIIGPTERFDGTDTDSWVPVFVTNLHGPVRLMQALKANLLAAKTGKAIAVSSGMGSIAIASSSDHLAYRCSKAALNMAMHAVAAEWLADGLIVAVLTPGVVDTDMAANIPLAKISPAESVAGMIGVIEGLTPADAGRFIRYNGEAVGW